MTTKIVHERWMPIDGYSSLYEVSDRGRVKSLPRTIVRAGTIKQPISGRILKPGISVNGYEIVTLSRLGRIKTFRVNRLVLVAFVGDCPAGMECCHFDGNRRNNHLHNLRWDTRKSNMMDALRHGTIQSGADHSNAKLDAESVEIIRSMCLGGSITQRKIGGMFGVAQPTISNIITGKTWKN